MDTRVEKLLNLPAYQRVLILLLVLGALIAGFYFLVYQGQLEEHERSKSRHSQAQQKLAESEKIAKNLPIYEAEYAKLQEELKSALGELPDKKEIPNLLTNIADLAKSQGLDVLRFKPQAEGLREFYAEVPVELKLTGSFHDVALFFDAVGKMKRIVNIQNLKIGGAKEAQGSTNLAVDCRALTFRFVEAPVEQPKKGGKRK